MKQPNKSFKKKVFQLVFSVRQKDDMVGNSAAALKVQMCKDRQTRVGMFNKAS